MRTYSTKIAALPLFVFAIFAAGCGAQNGNSSANSTLTAMCANSAAKARAAQNCTGSGTSLLTEDCRNKIARMLQGQINQETAGAKDSRELPELSFGVLEVIGAAVAARGGSLDKENAAVGIGVLSGLKYVFKIGEAPTPTKHSRDVWENVQAKLALPADQYVIEQVCGDMEEYRLLREKEQGN